MIILLGLAGSGKSTQGRRLAAKMGWAWLSAGEILRETGDPEVEAILAAGKLVPGELIERLMTEKMLAAVREGKDMIIDGFPREAAQAEWVAENFATIIRAVIILEVPREELERRLTMRGRADDTIEAIQERLRSGEENLRGVREALSGAVGCIKNVNGLGTEEEVFERMMEVIVEKPVENSKENGE